MRLLKREVVQSSVEDVCAEKLDVTEMEKGIRKTGIAIIGEASWGTHFCQFYQTKEDLIDVLVPYFKAGLENNEFCMWVTSEPLSEEEAKKAMRKAMPNFDRYVERGQIEIVSHTEWYLKDGAFNLQRVLNAWICKLDQALAKGYDGIRVTGNTAWLEKRDWKNFVDYEEEVNAAIGKYRMIAICTYSLDKCGASEVIDVVRNHQFALVRRRGTWELIESSELKRAKKVLRESEEKYRNLVNNSNDIVITADESANWTFLNPAVKRILGYEPAEMIGKSAFDFMLPEDIASTRKAHESVIREDRHFWEYENRWISKDGRVITLAWNVVALRDEQGNIIGTQGVGRDITEKKKAEEKLRFLKEFNERVVDSIGDALLVIDPYDYTIVSANEAALKQLKSRKEDLVGKTCYETTHHSSTPCKPPHDICPIQETLKTGKTVTVEHKHFDRDNNEMYVEVSASPVRNHEGKIVQVVHLSRGITERKKTEKKLQESEEKFRNIFDSANDGMIYLDRSGRILDVNKKAVQVFGGFKKELLGKHFTRVGIFSPREMPTLMTNFANILAGKNPSLNVCIKNKKGREIHLECSSSLMKIGEVVGTMVIARDVTERKKMEEKLKEYAEHLEEKVAERTRELRKSEERYSSIVNDAIDSLESGIFILDKDFKVVWINKAVERFFGVNRDNLIGEDKRRAIKEKIKYVFQDPERFEKTVLATYDNNTYVENFECHVLPTKDMEERFLFHWSTPIKTGAYAGGRIEHYYDVTKLKQMEQQILKSERLAVIGELATMVGHDLRNPLQSIENAAYYLNNELPRLSSSVPIPQKAIEMLHIISDSVNYADKIIRDLQDFSATKKPTLTKTDVNAIVKETLSQVEAPKNVGLITELDHIPEIKADKDMIKRVFLNLAVNGIQAMKNGGTLKVSTKKSKEFAEVSFKDTGVGMSKEIMEKLFTPFFTTKAKGMGMGLAICKRFVEIHKGSIKAESQEGKGTTFTVKLPIQTENGGEKT